MTLVNTATGEIVSVESPGLLAQYTDATGLHLPEGLEYDEWAGIGQVLTHMERAVHWWIGDWWRYGERSYGEAASQAAPTGYALSTVQGDAWVADRFPESLRRRKDLTFSHHREVAALAPPLQDALLDKAEANGWSSRELRQAVRLFQTDERIGRAAGEAPGLAAKGRYQIVYVDPPWRYEHAEPSRAVENNYPTMSLDEIKALGPLVPAAASSVLFMWATSPKLAESLEVVDVWGFEYRTCAVWVKDSIGMGYYARQRHELLLVARRGDLPVPAPANRPDSVIEAPRGEHSAKPEVVYDLIEKMYPGLAKVELFARRTRDGWAAWGNQVEVTA